MDRKKHHPQKIYVDEDALEKLQILEISQGISRPKMYGYAIEYAIRNWNNFENYVEVQENNS